MSYKKIDPDVLRSALALLPPEFFTKDLSSLDLVRAAHPELVAHSHYHSFVGRALAQIPELVHVGSGVRGARWHQCCERGAPAATAPAARPSSAVDSTCAPQPIPPSGLGPQCRSDNSFAKRMRLHQSWYRHAVLGVPCGTGPTRKSMSHYGNMLRPEHGREGLNFLTSGIHEVVMRRVAQGTDRVEPFRLLHNMLSSQPMCFNLFGPLVLDLDLARCLMVPLLGELAAVDEVRIEYSPECPATIRNPH